MSDPKSSYGEPVDEPNDVDHRDDVVHRAHEGLADAEAAQREVVVPAPAGAAATPVDADAPREPARQPETVAVEQSAYEADREAERRSEPRVDGDIPWYERDDIPFDDEPAVTASEPVPPHATAATAAGAAAGGSAAATAPRRDTGPDYATEPERSSDADRSLSDTSAAPAQASPSGPAQPIFVQAPEAPRPRGNRGAAGLIGLLAALVFAVLYLAARLGLDLVNGVIQLADVPQAALGALATWGLWVPTVAFFLGFWLLGVFINRGRWGHWVIWGLLAGVAAYGGHILGQLFEAPFWMLTAREGATLLEEQSLAPLAIVAFVLGRELTIWFGAWVAARGRRMTELNTEAQREYERTLEAGPQLQHA